MAKKQITFKRKKEEKIQEKTKDELINRKIGIQNKKNIIKTESQISIEIFNQN